MTLLSVKQDVVKSMESHITWEGPSRSDFAVCEARCCEKHGKSYHLGGPKAEVTLLSVKQDVVKSMESHITWEGPSRSDFAVCEARCCEKHGKSYHLGGPKQK